VKGKSFLERDHPDRGTQLRQRVSSCGAGDLLDLSYVRDLLAAHRRGDGDRAAAVTWYQSVAVIGNRRVVVATRRRP
jgi:hypothetical protein